MNTNYNITLAPSALWSLQDAESFKLASCEPQEAGRFIDNILSRTIEAISQDPARYRYNTMLADKGIAIRERIDIDSQFRCLYEFDEKTGNVELLLFISTKQDLDKMLYRYTVLS